MSVIEKQYEIKNNIVTDMSGKYYNLKVPGEK